MVLSNCNNKKTIFSFVILVCDPVMGDNGKLYIKEDLISIYKDCVLPLADIITPNMFEAEILSGMKITIENIWEAVDLLHKRGCRTVVITSAELAEKDCLVLFASSRKGMYLFFTHRQVMGEEIFCFRF